MIANSFASVCRSTRSLVVASVRRWVPPVALFGALLVLPQVSQAQQSASASITADVQQPITVTKAHDLVFGSVFPGLNKTIAVTDANAASFSIAGQASANINMTFTLPATIASGGNTMPLATWTARTNPLASSATGTDFTPSASATSASLSAAGALHVYVGVTAQPSASQVAGTYTGTLTLTVVYF